MACRMVAKNRAVFLALMILVPSCKSGNKPEVKKTEPLNIIEVSAPGVMFNGKDLDGWEITNFGPQGPVYVSGDAIILGMGDGCTGITWKKEFPEINYEVTLEAKRIEGNDFFCGITFPVSKYPCSFIIGGWGGTTVGLSSVNGKDASENETTILRKFENDRWYSVRLRVTTDSIKAWIDSEMVVDFEIDNKVLSIRPEVELSKPFGIASWRTTSAVKSILVKGI